MCVAFVFKHSAVKSCNSWKPNMQTWNIHCPKEPLHKVFWCKTEFSVRCVCISACMKTCFLLSACCYCAQFHVVLFSPKISHCSKCWNVTCTRNTVPKGKTREAFHLDDVAARTCGLPWSIHCPGSVEYRTPDLSSSSWSINIMPSTSE